MNYSSWLLSPLLDELVRVVTGLLLTGEAGAILVPLLTSTTWTGTPTVAGIKTEFEVPLPVLMRLTCLFAIFLLTAAAQSAIDDPIIAYFDLADSQITALAQVNDDFNSYVQLKWRRLDQLKIAIRDARASDAPDALNIGRLYVEYELILRDVLARSTAWHAAAVAIITEAQRPRLESLRQADALGNTAFLAWNNNFIGPYLSSTSGSAYGNTFGYGLQDLFPDVRTYLGLSATQSATINSLFNIYSGSGTLLYYQLKQANVSAQLEFSKDPIDAAAVGNWIIGMDSYAKLPDPLVQLRQDLLAVLTDAQRQKLQNLESAFNSSYLARLAVCVGLVTPQLVNPHITPGVNGALFFDVNNPPDPNVGCIRY